MAKLLVDEEGTRRVVVLEDAITIGRGKENTVVIRDRKSSRMHCRVMRDGDSFVLEDLNSSNGTYLNDSLARREGLRDGDVIAIGQVSMTFVVSADGSSGDPAPAPLEDLLEPSTEENPILEDEDDGVESAATVLAGSSSILETQDDDDPTAETQTPYLEFVDGEREGDRVSVENSPFTFGRKVGNDLVISDARVSGQHARLVCEAGVWTIEDLDSGNGVFIGKQRVKRHTLRPGDRIGLGSTQLIVGGIDGPTATAPPRAAAQVLRGVDEGEFSEEEISRLDVQRVIDQPSPYQALFTGLFVMVMLALLFFGWGVANRFIAFQSGIDPENLIDVNPSFETVGKEPGTVPGWRLSESARGQASIETVVREPKSRHGRRSLRLTATGEVPGGLVRVETTDAYDLRAGEGLRISGQLRNDSFTLAALEIIWLVRAENDLRVIGTSFTTPIRPGRTYRNLDSVVYPPAGSSAEKARVAIFARGRGTLEADAISLKSAVGDPPSEIVQTLASQEDSDRDLSFQFERDGSFSVHQGRSRVLRNLRFAAPAPDELPLGQIMSLNTESPTIQDNGAVRGSFAFLARGQEESVVDQLSQQLVEAQRIRWQVTSWSPASSVVYALVAELENRAAQAPMAVFSGGERVAEGKLQDLDGAAGDEWVLGKDARQIIFALNTTVELRVLPANQTRGGTPTLQLSATSNVPDGVLELYVSTLSTREQQRIAGVLERVEEARKAGRGGEACELLEQLEEQFAHLEGVREQAQAIRTEIESRAREEMADLQAIQVDLQKYDSAPIAELLAARIERFRECYKGLAFVSDVDELASLVKGTQREEALASRSAAAGEILQMGMDHYKENRDELARFYFQWVVRTHPDTPEAADARQQLAILKARYGERS